MTTENNGRLNVYDIYALITLLDKKRLIGEGKGEFGIMKKYESFKAPHHKGLRSTVRS